MADKQPSPVAEAMEDRRDDKCKQSKVGNGVGLTFFGFPRSKNLLRVNIVI